MLELAKFKAELGQFTGTEHYYCNPLYQEMNYTDGVKYLAATVGLLVARYYWHRVLSQAEIWRVG
jgi:hypothetical protein